MVYEWIWFFDTVGVHKHWLDQRLNSLASNDLDAINQLTRLRLHIVDYLIIICIRLHTMANFNAILSALITMCHRDC